MLNIGVKKVVFLFYLILLVRCVHLYLFLTIYTKINRSENDWYPKLSNLALLLPLKESNPSVS